MNTNLTKMVISAVALATSLLACSSSPPDEAVYTSHEDLTSPTNTVVCGACQVDGQQSCTEYFGDLIRTYEQTCSSLCPNVYPSCILKGISKPWPAYTSFLSEFGCTASGYWQDDPSDAGVDLAKNSEAYALCPQSSALKAYVKADPDGLGATDIPLHEARACDACLAAAVPGWTYVFFFAENLITPRPGSCGGTACLSTRW